MIRWSLQSIRSAMGTITSSRTTMLPAEKSKNGRHKSPDLKPIDNFWADIKPDLSRNTQRNVLEFEITIHDILNQIPTKRSSQCLVGSRTVSILVVAIPAIMLLFVVL